LSRFPLSYKVCVVGGSVIGFVWGDDAFPQLEKAFGDPLTALLLALGGALVGALAHEIVTSVCALTLR
jgi:hypothetical protein